MSRLALYQPSVVTIDCSEQTHRLRWQGGDLIAVDHHDPDVERSLAELSGQPRHCLDTVEAWNRHSDDPRSLVLGPRAVSDRIAHFRPGGSRWPFPPRPDEDLLSLLTENPVLARLLVCTVADRWANRIRDGDPSVEEHRPALSAALFGRVAPAIRAWLEDEDLDVRVHMTDDRRRLVRYPDRVDAFLPFDWIVDVWGTEVTSMFNGFVLAAETARHDHLALSTVGRDFETLRTVTITAASDA